MQRRITVGLGEEVEDNVHISECKMSGLGVLDAVNLAVSNTLGDELKKQQSAAQFLAPSKPLNDDQVRASLSSYPATSVTKLV